MRSKGVLHHGSRLPAEIVLPVLTAATALLTIVVCYRLARANGDLPEWLHVAQISLLGCRGPERVVFQIGFVTTAILLVACIVLYLDHALARFEPWLRWEVSGAAVLAIVAAGGLGLLGAIPLQRDCIRCLEGVAALQQESLVHGSGAAVFFTCSWLHGIIAIHVYGRSPRNRAAPRLALARTARIVFVVLPVLTMPLAALASKGAPTPKVRMQVGAAHQWVAIGSMLGLFLSYTDDMLHFKQEASERAAVRAEEHLTEAASGSGPSEDGEWLEASDRTPPARLAHADDGREYTLVSPPPNIALPAGSSGGSVHCAASPAVAGTGSGLSPRFAQAAAAAASAKAARR